VPPFESEVDVAKSLSLWIACGWALGVAPVALGAEVAATVGSKAEAEWTDTTTKAATTPEQQAQLKSGKPATVTGEVIDISCYLQLGKRGEKHIPCGTKCLTNGQPIGLLDDAGETYELFAEQHDPRRDGTMDLKATFIPLLAKRVTVTGILTEKKGVKALFVRAGALVMPSAVPTPVK
jgi:hypothetical protein